MRERREGCVWNRGGGKERERKRVREVGREGEGRRERGREKKEERREEKRKRNEEKRFLLTHFCTSMNKCGPVCVCKQSWHEKGDTHCLGVMSIIICQDAEEHGSAQGYTYRRNGQNNGQFGTICVRLMIQNSQCTKWVAPLSWHIQLGFYVEWNKGYK